jgi:hypothetical protein
MMSAALHTNAIEVVWVIVTCVGASLKFMILLDARYDYRRTLKLDDPEARFTFGAIYHSAQILMLAHVLIAASAIFGIFNAPPPPSYKETPQAFFSVLVGIAVSLTLTWHATLTRVWRHRISVGQYDGHDRRRSNHRSDPDS